MAEIYKKFPSSLHILPSMETMIEFVDIQKNLAVKEILVGREVAVRVSGLPPKTKVVLKCGNAISEAEVLFESDSNGVVDLGKQAPLSGSYSGIDPDGIFWSRKTLASPAEVPAPFRCRAFVGDRQAAAAELKQLYKQGALSRQELTLNENGFVGEYVTPEGSGPFPALLILGGSEGGLDRFTPQYFASLGYASLSVAYHAYPGLPDSITTIPMEYFRTSLNWLQGRAEVSRHKIAVFGTSRGGELALVLASTYPEFAAVITNEGSGLVWEGFEPGDNRVVSSWSHHGESIPFVKYTQMPPVERLNEEGQKIFEFSNMFLDAMAKSSDLSKATIPVEKINAPILSLAGDADQIWPSKELAEVLQARRKQFGLDQIDSYLYFKDAGHTIGMPGYPTTNLVFFHPVAEQFWFAGGTPQGNAKAQREGWNAILKFLDKNLR